MKETVEFNTTTHPIMYGMFLKEPNRIPVVMMKTKLDDNVFTRLVEAPMFSCPEKDLEMYGMKKAVDYPKSKNTHTSYLLRRLLS